MVAKIYKPSKTATQSGRNNAKNWILEFEHDGSSNIEPLMGWTSSKDTNQEVQLKFSSKENAIKFAKSNNIEYEIYDPEERNIVPKSYASNFK